MITGVLKREYQDFHAEHPGIARMKALMRSYVFLAEYEQRNRRKRKIFPMKTERPYSRQHRFTVPMNGHDYLIVIVDFANLPDMIKCKNATHNGTMRFLHDLSARFGIPDIIMLDNRTPFVAKELKDFCQAFSIVHMTTAPYQLRSNGQGARFANTFKRTLKKSDGDNFKGIPVWHQTPVLFQDCQQWSWYSREK